MNLGRDRDEIHGKNQNKSNNHHQESNNDEQTGNGIGDGDEARELVVIVSRPATTSG